MFPLPHGAAWQTLFLICGFLLIEEIRSEARVVCYYTNWSIYRPGTAKFSPQNINPYLCTHLIYAFGGFTKDNTLKPFDKYQDIEKGGYAKFTGLKTYNKNLKTLLAIGGWNEGSSRFSPLMANAERRQQFIKNILKFLRQNHFDGLDLDWEYPAFRDGGKSRDKDNYAQFVEELRSEFDRESAKTGRPRLLLTMAVPAGIEYIEKGYDIPKLNKYLDWFNLLTYDYHSAYEPSVNHHSPLKSLEEDNEYNYDSELNIDYTIKYYLNAGADKDKLVLGIPTYGRSYTLINEEDTEIGAAADGPGEQGEATREKGYLAYYEICQTLRDDREWTVVKPNPKAMGPYAYRKNQWVGYDDEEIVKRKAEYVVENGLGGIMFWSIDNDDFRGTCTGKPYPLIEAAKEAMLERLGVGDNEVARPNRPKKPSRSRSRPGSSSNRNKISEDTYLEKPTSTPKKRISSNRRRTSTTTTTTTTTTLAPKTTSASLYIGGRTTTPAPPTTPDPGTDFKCEEEGFFPHPRDCKKYFWCLDSGPSNLGIVAHQFTCPSGLYFNTAADSCDFSRNVLCKKSTTTAKPTTQTKPATTTTTTTTTTTSSPKVTAATSRNTFLKYTTTTTTPEPEYLLDDEEYDDEEDQHNIRSKDSEEDPKVIKELIELIKKVGGLEELEKQLQFQEDGSMVLKSDKTQEVSTTPSSISKSLYSKVLSRPNSLNSLRNRFGAGKASTSTPKPKTNDGSSETSSHIENKYSSVIRNSRPSPQNAGIEKLPEFEGFLKEKPKYVTISRTRPTQPSSDDVDKSDEFEDEDDEEDDKSIGLISEKYDNFETTKPSYVNIRRSRPTTTTSKPDEYINDAANKETVTDATQRNTYQSINRRRSTTESINIEEENTPQITSTFRYKTIERTRPSLSKTSSEDLKTTYEDDIRSHRQTNDGISSPVTVQFSDLTQYTKSYSTQKLDTTTTRTYANIPRRTTSANPVFSTTLSEAITTISPLLPELTTSQQKNTVTTFTSSTSSSPTSNTSPQTSSIPTSENYPKLSTEHTLFNNEIHNENTLRPSTHVHHHTISSGLDTEVYDTTILTDKHTDTTSLHQTTHVNNDEVTLTDGSNKNSSEKKKVVVIDINNSNVVKANTNTKLESSPQDTNLENDFNLSKINVDNKNHHHLIRDDTVQNTDVDITSPSTTSTILTTPSTKITTTERPTTTKPTTTTSTTTSSNIQITVSSPRPFGFPRRRTRPPIIRKTSTINNNSQNLADTSSIDTTTTSSSVTKKVSPTVPNTNNNHENFANLVNNNSNENENIVNNNHTYTNVVNGNNLHDDNSRNRDINSRRRNTATKATINPLSERSTHIPSDESPIPSNRKAYSWRDKRIGNFRPWLTTTPNPNEVYLNEYHTRTREFTPSLNNEQIDNKFSNRNHTRKRIEKPISEENQSSILQNAEKTEKSESETNTSVLKRKNVVVRRRIFNNNSSRPTAQKSNSNEILEQKKVNMHLGEYKNDTTTRKSLRNNQRTNLNSSKNSSLHKIQINDVSFKNNNFSSRNQISTKLDNESHKEINGPLNITTPTDVESSNANHTMKSNDDKVRFTLESNVQVENFKNLTNQIILNDSMLHEIFDQKMSTNFSENNSMVKFSPSKLSSLNKTNFDWTEAARIKNSSDRIIGQNRKPTLQNRINETASNPNFSSNKNWSFSISDFNSAKEFQKTKSDNDFEIDKNHVITTTEMNYLTSTHNSVIENKTDQNKIDKFTTEINENSPATESIVETFDKITTENVLESETTVAPFRTQTLKSLNFETTTISEKIYINTSTAQNDNNNKTNAFIVHNKNFTRNLGTGNETVKTGTERNSVKFRFTTKATPTYYQELQKEENDTSTNAKSQNLTVAVYADNVSKTQNFVQEISELAQRRGVKIFTHQTSVKNNAIHRFPLKQDENTVFSFNRKHPHEYLTTTTQNLKKFEEDIEENPRKVNPREKTNFRRNSQHYDSFKEEESVNNRISGFYSANLEKETTPNSYQSLQTATEISGKSLDRTDALSHVKVESTTEPEMTTENDLQTTTLHQNNILSKSEMSVTTENNVESTSLLHSNYISTTIADTTTERNFEDTSFLPNKFLSTTESEIITKGFESTMNSKAETTTEFPFQNSNKVNPSKSRNTIQKIVDTPVQPTLVNESNTKIKLQNTATIIETQQNKIQRHAKNLEYPVRDSIPVLYYRQRVRNQDRYAKNVANSTSNEIKDEKFIEKNSQNALNKTNAMLLKSSDLDNVDQITSLIKDQNLTTQSNLNLEGKNIETTTESDLFQTTLEYGDQIDFKTENLTTYSEITTLYPLSIIATDEPILSSSTTETQTQTTLEPTNSPQVENATQIQAKTIAHVENDNSTLEFLLETSTENNQNSETTNTPTKNDFNSITPTTEEFPYVDTTTEENDSFWKFINNIQNETNSITSATESSTDKITRSINDVNNDQNLDKMTLIYDNSNDDDFSSTTILPTIFNENFFSTEIFEKLKDERANITSAAGIEKSNQFGRRRPFGSSLSNEKLNSSRRSYQRRNFQQPTNENGENLIKTTETNSTRVRSKFRPSNLSFTSSTEKNNSNVKISNSAEEQNSKTLFQRKYLNVNRTRTRNENFKNTKNNEEQILVENVSTTSTEKLEEFDSTTMNTPEIPNHTTLRSTLIFLKTPKILPTLSKDNLSEIENDEPVLDQEVSESESTTPGEDSSIDISTIRNTLIFLKGPRPTQITGSVANDATTESEQTTEPNIKILSDDEKLSNAEPHDKQDDKNVFGHKYSTINRSRHKSVQKDEKLEKDDTESTTINNIENVIETTTVSSQYREEEITKRFESKNNKTESEESKTVDYFTTTPISTSKDTVDEISTISTNHLYRGNKKFVKNENTVNENDAEYERTTTETPEYATEKILKDVMYENKRKTETSTEISETSTANERIRTETKVEPKEKSETATENAQSITRSEKQKTRVIISRTSTETNEEQTTLKNAILENKEDPTLKRVSSTHNRSRSRFKLPSNKSEKVKTENEERSRPRLNLSRRRPLPRNRNETKEEENQLGLSVPSKTFTPSRNRFRTSTTSTENPPKSETPEPSVLSTKSSVNAYGSQGQRFSRFKIKSTSTTSTTVPSINLSDTPTTPESPNSAFESQVKSQSNVNSTDSNSNSNIDGVNNFVSDIVSNGENLVKNLTNVVHNQSQNSSLLNINRRFQNSSHLERNDVKGNIDQVTNYNGTDSSSSVIMINGKRVRVIKKRRQQSNNSVSNVVEQKESEKLAEKDKNGEETTTQPIRPRHFRKTLIRKRPLNTTIATTTTSTTTTISPVSKLATSSEDKETSLEFPKKRYRKVLRRKRPLESKNENENSVNGTNEENYLKNQTTIEVTNEKNINENNDAPQLLPSKPKLSPSRRPYRPSKPSLNHLNTITSTEATIATSRAYIRKYSSNFTSPKPPSEFSPNLQEEERSSVYGRPLKVNRQKYKTRKPAFKTNLDFSENSDSSIDNSNENSFGSRIRFGRPKYTLLNQDKQASQIQENEEDEYYDEEDENPDSVSPEININSSILSDNESASPKIVTPNLAVRLNNGFIGFISKSLPDENVENIENVENNDEQDVNQDDEDYEDDESTVKENEPELLESPLPATTSAIPPTRQRVQNRPAFLRPSRPSNKPRVVNRPIFTTVHPASLKTTGINDIPQVITTTPTIPKITNTRQYTRTFSATTSTENTLLEEIQIDALNARNKKIFDINSKKHTTIRPKQINPQENTGSNTTTTPLQQQEQENNKHLENNNVLDGNENLNNFDTLQENVLENSITPPTTTTRRPMSSTTTKITTLHHVFAIDEVEDTTIPSQYTTLATTKTTTPVVTTDDERIGNKGTEKLVEINRVVEVYSKEDKLKLNSNTNDSEKISSTDLKIEKLPTIDKLGEISRAKFVKLVDPLGAESSPSKSKSSDNGELVIESRSTVADYTPTEATTAFAQSAPVRNVIPIVHAFENDVSSNLDDKKSRQLAVPEVILGVETSTIALEGLFETARKAKNIDLQDQPEPVYASSLGEVQSIIPLTENTFETSTMSSNTKTTTSLKSTTEQTTVSSSTSSTTTTPKSKVDKSTNYVRPLVPLLRPESNESSPLVISIANLDKVILSKVPKSDSSVASSGQVKAFIQPPPSPMLLNSNNNNGENSPQNATLHVIEEGSEGGGSTNDNSGITSQSTPSNETVIKTQTSYSSETKVIRMKRPRKSKTRKNKQSKQTTTTTTEPITTLTTESQSS